MARRTTTRRKTTRRKQGDAIKIAHTGAFELCEGGTCAKAESDSEEKVYCKQSDDCAKGGCYCQLFRRKPGVAESEAWLVAPIDHHHEAKYEPKKWDYKCLCVQPILEITHTEDLVDYKARLELCAGMGGCVLERTKSVPSDDLQCTGDCTDKKCKCTLFKLPTKGKPEDARWQIVAKGGKTVSHQKDFYYRCFCLK